MVLMGAPLVSIQEHGLYYLPGQEYSLRSNQSIVEAAANAERRKVVIDGIKGRSVLHDIIDLVKCVPIYYMHCVVEGVTKLLIKKWFTPTYHSCPFLDVISK